MKIRGGMKTAPEISQASLSDIAFLLLIFFIATTIFDLEMGIPLILPGAVSQRVQVSRKNVLQITSNAAGTVFIDGESVALPTLHNLVEARIAENPDLVVSIETHPEAAYQVMISVLDQVKMARAERISIRMNRG